MDIDRAARRVRVKDLQTLAEVVRLKGIRRAAETLHLSQPAVSRAILDLENALGVVLLQRGRRGVEPTVFGEALTRRTRAVLDELHGALREIAELSNPAAGEVRIGCMETLHAGLVTACVERVSKEHPRMRFVLESGQGNDLISYFLQQRRVDFVVARPLTLPLPPDVHGEDLFFDQLLVAVGRRNAFGRKRNPDLLELKDAQWILSRNELMAGAPLPEAFRRIGSEMPQHVISSGSLHTRYSLLDRGPFVTLVPHSLLPFADNEQRMRVLPIPLPRWDTATMILTIKGRALGPAVHLFLEHLRQMARPLSVSRAWIG